MSIECEGIPYADVFAVEVRWAARRHGKRDIIVEVGVEVDFKKSTLLKSKIRNSTIEETIPVHKDLFATVKAACAAASGEAAPEEETENIEEAIDLVGSKGEATLLDISSFGDYNIVVQCGALALLFIMWRLYSWFLSGGESNAGPELSPGDIAALSSRIGKLEAEIKAIHNTLDEILSLLKANNN
jgi:hypothetical protein